MTDTKVKFRDVRRNVRDSTHRVLQRLSGHGRKRKRVNVGNNLLELRRRRIYKETSFHNAFITDVGMALEALSVSSEFDIYGQKPVQTSVQGTIETIFRSTASMDQIDLEFFIPAEHDKDIDLNIRRYFHCQGK